jgi:hypothetical protein
VSNLGPFRQLVVVFGSVALWAATFWLLSRYMDVEHQLQTLAEVLLRIGRYALLCIGLIPIFAVFWVADGAFSEVSARALAISWKSVKGLFGLYELFPSMRPRIVGHTLGAYIALPILLPVILLGGLFIEFTWPTIDVIALLIVIAGGALKLKDDGSAERRSGLGVIADGIHKGLIPVTLGMCGVLLMQLVINVWDEDSETVRKYENNIGHLSEKAHHWTEFRFPSAIVLLCSLLVLSLAFPRWRPASHALRIKGIATQIAAGLLCISSYTFLSQVPFKYEDWKETKRLEVVYPRPKTDEDTRKAAVLATNIAVLNLLPEDRLYLRNLFSEISDVFPYREHKRAVRALLKPRLAKIRFEITSPADRQLKLPDHPEGSQTADQMLDSLEDFFCGALGLLAPDLRGIAQGFIDGIVESEASELFRRHIKGPAETTSDLQMLALASGEMNALKMEGGGENRDSKLSDELRNVESVVKTEDEAQRAKQFEEIERSEGEIKE